jgi:inner membrane transporter RhtA
MTLNRLKEFTPVALVIIAMICVQSGTALAKYIFPVLGASGTVTLRLGFASILILSLFQKNIFKLKKIDYLWSLLYGLCLGGMNLFFYYAIERIPMGLGTTIEFIGPLSLAILTSRKWIDIVWTVFATVGILLLAPWQATNGIDSIGLLFATLAGAFWAGYIFVGKQISTRVEPITAVGIGMFSAFIMVSPFGFNDQFFENLNVKWVLIGIGVAMLSSAIPFTLDMKAFKNMSYKTYSILMSLHPAFAALSGLVFLSEELNYLQWISVFSVIIASIGATITSKK